MIPNVMLVTNGKGGVGKTSLVANLAGIAAASGWRVLAVDTDPQGNLARDLGVLEQSDNGMNLRDAATRRQRLAPMIDVRPGLDLVCGGDELDNLVGDIQGAHLRGRHETALGMLETALAPVASSYDVIIVDSPPGEKSLLTAAARAARFLLIPTCPDDCSIDGLGAVFDRYAHLRLDGANPDLEILGVVLMLTVTTGSAIQRRARTTLTRLLEGDVTVFEASVRFAQAAAIDCRRTGRLAHEYELQAAHAEPWYTRIGQPRADSYSSAATGLAADYHAIAEQLFAAFTASCSVTPRTGA